MYAIRSYYDYAHGLGYLVDRDGAHGGDAHEEHLVEHLPAQYTRKGAPEHGKADEHVGGKEHGVFGDGKGRGVQGVVKGRADREKRARDRDSDQGPRAEGVGFGVGVGKRFVIRSYNFV